MICLNIGVGVIFVGYGVIALFFKDAAWEFHEFTNDLAGRESKRTELWEIGQNIGGAAMLILGIVFIILTFSNPM